MKTDNEYRRLAALAMEVEGLLFLLDARKGEDSSMIMELLGEKVMMLQGGIMSLPFPRERAEAEIEKEIAREEAGSPEKSKPAGPDGSSVNSDDVEKSETVKPVLIPTVGEAMETPETLDERIARERARDIKKAFTLNDKFRFRRELFHDSQEEFDETLDIISGMSSFAEAEEYFYNDLCWDPVNPEVKAFMDTVSKHF